MKRGLLFIACTLISGFVCAQIAKEYSFLDTSSNHFQAHQASLIGSLTEQIAQRNTPPFSVLHIGDELVRDVAQPLGEDLFDVAAHVDLRERLVDLEAECRVIARQRHRVCKPRR